MNVVVVLLFILLNFYIRIFYFVVYLLLFDNLFRILIFFSIVIISNFMYYCDFRGYYLDISGLFGLSESLERND